MTNRAERHDWSISAATLSVPVAVVIGDGSWDPLTVVGVIEALYKLVRRLLIRLSERPISDDIGIGRVLSQHKWAMLCGGEWRLLQFTSSTSCPRC